MTDAVAWQESVAARSGSIGFDCDGDNVPDFFDDPVVLLENGNFESGILPKNAALAQDVHLDTADSALITTLEVGYRSVGSSPGTMVIRLYDNDSTDSELPCPPSRGLIAEYSFGELEFTVKDFAVASVGMDPPQPVPADIWIEVDIAGDSAVILRGGAPTVGDSHGLVYDCATQGFSGGAPQYMALRLEGAVCSRDCNGNSIPDDQETDGDGDNAIDDCDDCPNDPLVISTVPETFDDDNCANGIDEDCDGLTDVDDPECLPATCQCADISNDGVVDAADFITFAGCFLLAAPGSSCDLNSWLCSDMNGTGLVDLGDFLIFIQSFGSAVSGFPPDCGG